MRAGAERGVPPAVAITEAVSETACQLALLSPVWRGDTRAGEISVKTKSSNAIIVAKTHFFNPEFDTYLFR